MLWVSLRYTAWQKFAAKAIYKTCMNVNNELTIIIPTKDRPVELKQVLEALSVQTLRPRKVIVVNSGQGVEPLVQRFSDSFEIQYLESKPGQVFQRNLGIDSARPKTKYVGFLDDDIVLKKDSLEKVFSFWAVKGDPVAGVSMNLVNIPKFQHSFFRGLLLLSSKTPGRVLQSGFNVPIHNLAGNFRSEWLPGGCTFWLWSVIDQFRQEPLDTKWAVGEDVRLSYPISQKYQLWVCSEATAEDLNLGRPRTAAQERFVGYRAAMAYFYLVQLNSALSKIACFYMVFTSSLVGIFIGLVSLRMGLVNRAIGQLKAIVLAAVATCCHSSVRKYLED